MYLIKIYKYSGVPTFKLFKMLKDTEIGSEKYKVINNILQRRNDRKLANFGRGAVSQLIYEYQKKEENSNRAQIGSKNTAYWKENEMLLDFKCNYLDLSEHEKVIFNNINTGDYWNKEKTHDNIHINTVSNFKF